MDISSIALLQTLDTFCQTSPYVAAALVCGIKGSAADFVAQVKERKETEKKKKKKAQKVRSLSKRQLAEKSQFRPVWIRLPRDYTGIHLQPPIPALVRRWDVHYRDG